MRIGMELTGSQEDVRTLEKTSFSRIKDTAVSRSVLEEVKKTLPYNCAKSRYFFVKKTLRGLLLQYQRKQSTDLRDPCCSYQRNPRTPEHQPPHLRFAQM